MLTGHRCGISNVKLVSSVFFREVPDGTSRKDKNRKVKVRFKKYISLLLALAILFNPIGVSVLYAQEAVTGDVVSEVTADVTANVNIETLPLEPSPAPVVIENENVGDVEQVVTSEAVSGESNIINDEDTSAVTGDAQATGQVDNTVNVNVVEVVEESLVPSPALEITNDNTGEVDNTIVISAVSGENEVVVETPSSFAKLETGNALALLNLINLLNLNFVNSGFRVLTLDDLNELGKTVDLNALWNQLQERLGTTSEDTTIVNDNDGTLSNEVVVEAVTGENTVVGNEESAMTTGDTTALANIFNLINANLVDSRMLFAFVNLINSSDSDLILPNPEKFALGTSAGDGSGIQNNNTATITDSLEVEAVSSGAGDSTSVANNITIANLDMYFASQFFFLVNNLGGWTGKVLNWGTPGSELTQNEVTQIYSFGVFGQGGGQLPLVTNNNQAQVTTNLEVSAVSGNNNGLDTGDSRAAGNIFNLINANLFRSHLFVGFLNISNWRGNIIFAYPDVQVSLSTSDSQKRPGETFTYYLTAINTGYDEARGVVVTLNLPEDVIGLGETVWNLGNLGSGESKTIEVLVQVRPDFSFGERISFWQKIGIIKEASAATPEKSRYITAQAYVTTTDSESNLINNLATADMKVYIPADNSDGIDHRQPTLEITATNNVSGFVYDGDTVTFNVTVKNTSDTPSYETRLVQKLVGADLDMVVAEFPLGTIPAGSGGNLSFGFKLPKGSVPAGSYHTLAQAYGKANDGVGISSNEAQTAFAVKVRYLGLVSEVEAAGEEEEVLGTDTLAPSCPIAKDNIYPYLILLMMSMYILTRIWRGKTRWENGANKIFVTVGISLVLGLSLYKVFVYVKPMFFDVQAQIGCNDCSNSCELCTPCTPTCPTCPPRPTPSPTTTPEVTPTPTATPSDDPTPTPTPDPTTTPTETPTSEPTPTPTENSGTGGTTESSDTTSTPPQVLGTSTLAKTGGLEEMIMNLIFATGSILSALGIRKKFKLSFRT